MRPQPRAHDLRRCAIAGAAVATAHAMLLAGVVAAALSLGGCGSDSAAVSGDGGVATAGSRADGDADAGPAAPYARVDACGFAESPAVLIDVHDQLDILHAGRFSRVSGWAQSGPSPSFHRIALDEGGCRYLELGFGVCEPECDSGALCTADDRCVAFPERRAAGTLSLEGLSGGVLEIAPDGADNYVGPGGLPYPLFAAGDAVVARLSGDALPAVALQAPGVAPMDDALVVSGLTITHGAAATIEWEPGPDPDACIEIVLNGANATHGAPLDDVIVCQGLDSGSLEIPVALVDRFPVGSTPVVTEGFDWPYSEITRYARTSRDTDAGPARLIVRSTSQFTLESTAQ